jgi:hypothetical protein
MGDHTNHEEDKREIEKSSGEGTERRGGRKAAMRTNGQAGVPGLAIG